MSQVRACALKICNITLIYAWPNRRNFRALHEIGVEGHDGEYK